MGQQLPQIPAWAMRALTMSTCLLATWVMLSLALSLTTPWFQVTVDTPNGPNDKVESLFTWDYVLVDPQPGLVLQEDYKEWTMPLNGVDIVMDISGMHDLSTTVLIFVLVAALCWTVFTLVTVLGALSWWNGQLRSALRRYNLARFASVYGCVGCAALFSAWISYCFASVALNNDLSSGECDIVGACDSFSGSSDGASWGPYTGWSFALIGSVCSCCTFLLFLVAFAVDLFDPYLAQYVTVAPSGEFLARNTYEEIGDRSIDYEGNPSAAASDDGPAQFQSKPVAFPITDGRNPYDD